MHALERRYVNNSQPNESSCLNIHLATNSFSWPMLNGFPVNSYSSLFVLKSIRTHFSQFVLKILVNSYSFGQFVLMSGQFVLILVNSYSFWSFRTQTQMSTN